MVLIACAASGTTLSAVSAFGALAALTSRTTRCALGTKSCKRLSRLAAGPREATINLQCVRVTVTTMSARPGFGLKIPQQGMSCGVYATIIYCFTKALMRDRFFAPCYAGQSARGPQLSISISDKKMDDWARDCVVRLANRVDDEKLRERLLQMAREWNPAAKDAGNRSSAVT